MPENSFVSIDSSASDPEEVRSRLAALPGVGGVDVTGLPDSVTVRFDVEGLRELAESALRGILATELGLGAELRTEIEDRPAASRSTRARFESLHVAMEEAGRIVARVVLQWNGSEYLGEGSAEASPAGELRASALAAIEALEQLIGGPPAFTLIGVKELYVFDHHVVAVLLYSPRLPRPRLVGLSMLSQDRPTSAVLAVLNATNRAVGSLR